jgi:hypothetical protein
MKSFCKYLLPALVSLSALTSDAIAVEQLDPNELNPIRVIEAHAMPTGRMLGNFSTGNSPKRTFPPIRSCTSQSPRCGNSVAT